MNIEKMYNVRANNVIPTVISSDGEFYNSIVEYIEKNSKLLNRSIILKLMNTMNYYFDIENSSNKVYEGTISSQFKPLNSITCTTKSLVSEYGMNKLKYNTYFKEMDKNKEKMILENIVYKPFLRSIEKNVISGNYFDKSLFNTSDIITGTNDFNGLLKLIRYLKNKNENNCVVVNPSIMYGIIDTITKESYLNEYLLNKTIEGVEIIETLECPNNKIVGVDPTKICLVVSPELQIQKFSSLENIIDYHFHIFCFVNGGDMFNSSVSMDV
jgi:hypothetical protein